MLLKHFRYYDLILTAFAAMLLISNLAATKLIAFGGILGAWDMVLFILIGWGFKTGVEVVMLPVTYRVISWLKRRESVDVYDKKTDFSPLSILLLFDICIS